MLEYISSTFLSKLLPIQFLFCPQKLISSVWLIAIIFSVSYNQQCLVVFSFFCQTLQHYSLWQRASGCAESKVDSCWKDSDFSGLWIMREQLSFCALHHSWKACLLLVAASCLSFLKQPSFRAGLLLRVVWSWEVPPLRFSIWLSCVLRQILSPSSPFWLWLLQEAKCFAFSLGKKKRLDLLRGESGYFRGRTRGSELPSWAWKCQYWCNEESPVEKK